MTDFTRRSLLQGGTALGAAGALTGPALFDFAKAWAQAAPWKPEKGAKLTLMRWKRFVEAEDKAFMEMVAAFKAATGADMNVFSESFEDVQPKASVAANTGSGLDLVWGLHSLPQLFPQKCLDLNDVANYLGKKYGGWTDCGGRDLQARQQVARHSGRDHRRLPDLPQVGGGEGGLQGIPEGLPGLPRTVQGAEEEQHAGRLRARPCLGRRQCLAALDPVGPRRLPGRQGRQGHHQFARDREGARILQGAVRHLHSGHRVVERLVEQQGVPGGRTPSAPTTASRSTSRRRTMRPRRISPRTWITRSGRSARSASRPSCSSAFRSWRSTSPSSRKPRRPSSPSCWRRRTTIRGCEARAGYLSHPLNAYDADPVWTADPKNTVFSDAGKRTLPARASATPGEKAATAIADFIVVDMFANFCTGREDVKGAIAMAERQPKRIYR